MALSPEQLQAMMNMAPTPDASAGALGHSTGVMSNFIKGAENWLPTAGAVAGGIGGAALGGLVGAPTGPGAAVTGYAGGVAGAGLGASAGEALKEHLQGQQLNPGEIAKQGGINAAFEAVGGPLLSGAGKVLGKVASPIVSGVGKLVKGVGDVFGGSGGLQAAKATTDAVGEHVVQPVTNAFVDPAAQATKRVASTAQTMSKGERLGEGDRLVPTATGGAKFTPAESEQRAGGILANKLTSNPVKNLPIIKNEIATRGAEAEKYLTEHPTLITPEEHQTMFASQAANSETYMTATQKQAYKEQIGVFNNVLKSLSDSSESWGHTTANYYKALKDYETNVTEHLPKGKEALLDVNSNARIQAAQDVRAVVRDMIGQKNPEFQGKMYDLSSLYDARDNVAQMADKMATQGTSHPVIKKVVAGAATLGGGIILGNEGKKLGL